MDTALVKSTDLVRALGNASLFAVSQKDPNPILKCTELTFVDTETIQLVTTDSYALLHEIIPAEIPTAMVGQSRLVNLYDVKPLIVSAKVNKYCAVTIGTETDNQAVTFVEIGSGATFTVKEEEPYPKWKGLVPVNLDGISAGPTLGVGLWQLARLGKIVAEEGSAKDHNMPSRWEILDASHLFRVTIGSSIWVLIMPVRL